MNNEAHINGPEDRPLPPRKLRANGDAIFDLAETARADAMALKDAPRMLRKVLEREAWRSFADPYSKKTFEYGPDDFEKFTLAKRPAGLELPEGIKTLIGICDLAKGDVDAEVAARLLREKIPPAATHSEAGAMGGRGKKADSNTTSFRDRGEAYQLRRLKRDRPDLAEKVVNGEMTAHKAALAAGVVKFVVQHQPTVDGFRRAAFQYLTPDQREQLKEALDG